MRFAYTRSVQITNERAYLINGLKFICDVETMSNRITISEIVQTNMYPHKIILTDSNSGENRNRALFCNSRAATRTYSVWKIAKRNWKIPCFPSRKTIKISEFSFRHDVGQALGKSRYTRKIAIGEKELCLPLSVRKCATIASADSRIIIYSNQIIKMILRKILITRARLKTLKNIFQITKH